MVELKTQEATDAETVYCTYHPDRATLLRCNRCGQPICYQCAIRTPVGYRCKQCVRSQQAVYYTAHSYDLAIAAAVGLVLSAIAGALAFAFLNILGIFFAIILGLFAGPAAGGIIAEGVRRSVGRRRARHMNLVVAGAAVVGIVIGGVLLFAGPALAAGAPLFVLARVPALLISRIGALVFTVTAASTIYARLQ